MLGLFKRTKIKAWEIDLLRNTIRLLPLEYRHLEQQIDEGLFKGVLIGLSDLPGYVGFKYNPKILKKFDDKKDRLYTLTGIKVLDAKSKKYLPYTVYVSTGTITGYSITGAEKFIIDVNSIDVTEFKKKYPINVDYQKIEPLLTIKEKKAINPDDVYEVILDNKTYFHIKDLEDGDFIGMDFEKNIYEITHDPYEIKLMKCNLIEVF